MMEHRGSIEDLRSIIGGCGFTIIEEKEQQNGPQFRTAEGAILNFYTATGRLQVQGKVEPKAKFEQAWSDYTGRDKFSAVPRVDMIKPEKPENPKNANRKVFLVHGHDQQAREQLELVVHKLGLDPFVLANTGGGGLTIIEALEAEIGPNDGNARFGIVLMTPDDVGYSKVDGAAKAEPRARQNVVLEMGMLIAAIGRGNVAILKKGHLDEPSDARGILYIPFNDHVKEAVPRLVDRLREAGFVLNPENITKASS